MPINPDKIKVIERPFYRPSVDIYDGDTEGPVVQLGVTVDRNFGDLYVKVEHLEFIARTHLNMVSGEEYALLLDKNAELIKQNEELLAGIVETQESEQSEFNSKLDGLFAGYANRDWTANPPVASDSANKAEPQAGTKAKLPKVSFD